MKTTALPGDAAVSQRRGRPRSLSEHEIVEAALRLTSEVGLDKLSMRGLARELGSPPMTVYDYVRNREGLLELLVDQLLRDVRIPGPEDGTWDQRLRLLLGDARRVFADHPGVSSRLGDRGAPEGRRLAAGVMGILRDAGFDAQRAVLCFATLYTYVTGQMAIDAVANEHASSPPAVTLEGVLQPGGLSDHELFDFGLAVIIDGLKLRLQRPEAVAPPRSG
ncbi:MAG: TetR/AcrR family transcriptional regulator [Acidimicrobiales bacterium]